MIVILCIRPYFAEQDADLRLQNFSAVIHQPLFFPQLGVDGVLAQERWAQRVYDWNTVAHQLKAQLHLLEKAVNDVFQLITGEPNGQDHEKEDTVTSFSFLTCIHACSRAVTSLSSWPIISENWACHWLTSLCREPRYLMVLRVAEGICNDKERGRCARYAYKPRKHSPLQDCLWAYREQVKIWNIKLYKGSLPKKYLHPGYRLFHLQAAWSP